MPLKEHLQKDQRLVILRVLSEQVRYCANESMLQEALCLLGHSASREKTKTEMHYLAEQELVTLTEPLGVLVATATSRGLDVAQGLAIHHGVKRPRP
ncbi:MAG: VpaChn25_0724 family phage protein [Vibrio sp.]